MITRIERKFPNFLSIVNFIHFLSIFILFRCVCRHSFLPILLTSVSYFFTTVSAFDMMAANREAACEATQQLEPSGIRGLRSAVVFRLFHLNLWNIPKKLWRNLGWGSRSADTHLLFEKKFCHLRNFCVGVLFFLLCNCHFWDFITSDS